MWESRQRFQAWLYRRHLQAGQAATALASSGGRYCSPLASTAQAMRASLLANATIAMLGWVRDIKTASALFALEHGDEELDRLHVQHFGFFVADHMRLTAVLAALAQLRRASDDLFNTLQMRGQFIAARMGLAAARCLRCCR